MQGQGVQYDASGQQVVSNQPGGTGSGVALGVRGKMLWPSDCWDYLIQMTVDVISFDLNLQFISSLHS